MRRALLIVALAVACVGVGRLSAPGSAAETSPSPDREVAGVALGYPHTRAGATLAAAGYQQAFSGTEILRPGVLRARIEAISTPGFAKTMLAANSPGATRLAAGAIGEGVRSGVQSAFFAVPLGYRVLSYSPVRTRIRTWGFTILGNAASAEPTAYFGTARTELVWQGGDWKIAATRAGFGPTPPLGTPRRGGEGFAVIDLLEEMRPYEIAR